MEFIDLIYVPFRELHDAIDNTVRVVGHVTMVPWMKTLETVRADLSGLANVTHVENPTKRTTFLPAH